MKRSTNHRPSKCRQRSERYRPGLLSLEDRLCLSLTLTQAGQDAGIGLSIFAVGFPHVRTPGGDIGPLGIAFPSSGGVLVTDWPGNARLFPTDADGQNATQHPPGRNYGGGNAFGLAQVGDAIYLASQQSGAGVYQLNVDGTLNRLVVKLPNAGGIVTNPVNGHLFVSNGHQIRDVDPLANPPTSTVFFDGGGGANFDGLTISADGRILYAANLAPARVQGFDTNTHKVVFTSGVIPGGLDGVAEGIGPLTGNLFVNCNNGTVVEINIATNQQTPIASGGSRGDFVTVDPHNYSVLLTQTDRIVRMTFPFGAAHQLTVSGFPASTLTGISHNLTVTALDQNGNPAIGYTGSVHFASSDLQATLPADYTFTAADGGVHTFAVTFATAGSQSITATDTTDPRLAATQSAITVTSAATAGIFAVGGAPGHVQVHRVSDGSTVADFAPYGPSYHGGVSVAVGDVDGDGFPDLVTGATVGNPQVKVFSSRAFFDGSFNAGNPDADLLASFFAYGLNFNVGANVAVGDVNHDGFADIVTGATVGNPQVKVYDGQAIAHHSFNGGNPDASLLASFFAYGLQFNIGANVAVGDVNHDGFADVVTGATAGNPQVKVYDGQAIANHTFDGGNPDASLLASFFAFGLQFNVGAFVAVGDVNGDGFGDVIVGATAGNPQVKVYDGQAIANHSFNGGNPDANLLTNFYAYDLGRNIGASVGVADFDVGGPAEILTGAAQGAPHYRVVKGLASGIQPPADHGIDAIASDISGGILVGG